jgi:hypothetical protein
MKPSIHWLFVFLPVTVILEHAGKVPPPTIFFRGAESAASVGGEFSHAGSVTFVILMSTFAQSCSEPPTRGLANANDYQRLSRRANSGSWIWL